MRSMIMKVHKGQVIYSSQFDPKTGSIVRAVERETERYNRSWEFTKEQEERYQHGRRYGSSVFSPVPETVDISITDKCGFGCTYCYQDSRPRREHAPKDLVEKIILGFDSPPYQIAIGGGEPTEHPDFPYILRRARELGTVPNYTTNGEKLIPEVVEATNEVCGGVAMTYHAFKGIEWFVKHYKALREAIKVQVNVHLIADKDVAKNLLDLISRKEELGKLRLVLLAYYPDVGRANMDGILDKKTYMRDLPKALIAAQEAGYDIAFSEGLLPFILSRPELGIRSQFFMRSEGLFSCYFNPKGQMSHSSFSPAHEDEPTVWAESPQKMWDSLHTSYGPGGNACYHCKMRSQCSTPHKFHYLSCAFAEHNLTPLKDEAVKEKKVHLPLVGPHFDPKEELLMALQIGMNIGFITNSSSVVHHVPREIFDHPEIQAFLKAYEADTGFVGSDMWHRGECGSLAVTREQKLDVKNQFEHNCYDAHPPTNVNPEDDSEVILVYGDEHEDLAYMLAEMLRDVSEKMGKPMGYGRDFNLWPTETSTSSGAALSFMSALTLPSRRRPTAKPLRCWPTWLPLVGTRPYGFV